MKVIITGATGYVGEGVLIDCLRNPEVEKILSISRKPTGIQHEKLEEWIVPDFMEIDNSDNHLSGYDAVFFCAGITSVGTPKDVYKIISQDIPLHLAEVLPDKSKMTFIYVSGAGTRIDGPQEWQKVKGTTEKRLMEMGFRNAFGYRPCQMTPTKGQKTKQVAVQWILCWLLPIGWICGFSNTIGEVARSMVAISRNGYHKQFISAIDIRKLAKH